MKIFASAQVMWEFKMALDADSNVAPFNGWSEGDSACDILFVTCDDDDKVTNMYACFCACDLSLKGTNF